MLMGGASVWKAITVNFWITTRSLISVPVSASCLNSYLRLCEKCRSNDTLQQISYLEVVGIDGENYLPGHLLQSTPRAATFKPCHATEYRGI